MLTEARVKLLKEASGGCIEFKIFPATALGGNHHSCNGQVCDVAICLSFFLSGFFRVS